MKQHQTNPNTPGGWLTRWRADATRGRKLKGAGLGVLLALSGPLATTVLAAAGDISDLLHGYPATLTGTAVLSQSTHTGTGYSVDLSTNGTAWVTISNASFMNIATSNNVMAMSMWVKKGPESPPIAGSAFWGDFGGVSGSRGWNVHFPWSDDNIYFDTDGCCDGTLERINASITTFAGYEAFGTNDGWWTNWHHFVAQDNLGDKQIWIDGQLFVEGTNTAALPTDLTIQYLGYDYGDAVGMHGLVDDYAVYSTALDATDIGALFNGTAPTAISAKASLMAYWPFNDPPQTTTAPKPTIDIALVNGKLVITYTGTLLSSATVSGTYSAVAGAASPYTVPAASGPHIFYRAQQ